jgi:cell division septum initiation protein DivIVA
MLQQSKHPSLADESYATLLEERLVPAEIRSKSLESSAVFTAIERLEDRILNSPRVPLTGKTMVNEEELLEHLDTIRAHLPEVIITAQEILQYKDRLIREAQQQVQQILAEANQRAYQVANELGIIERAEQEAKQIRQQAISECEQLRQQAMVEVQRVSERHFQDIDRLRAQVEIECQQTQDGADEYADRVLHSMEYQLTDILHAIQRGRQRLLNDVTADVQTDRQSIATEQKDAGV